MAKRKVIVYKDPYGKGGYINKTAKWLKKLLSMQCLMKQVKVNI